MGGGEYASANRSEFRSANSIGWGQHESTKGADAMTARIAGVEAKDAGLVVRVA